MTKQNAAEILGISPDAKPADIKSAYRRLVKQYHPDKLNGENQNDDKFKQVARAYAIMTGRAQPDDEQTQHVYHQPSYQPNARSAHTYSARQKSEKTDSANSEKQNFTAQDVRNSYKKMYNTWTGMDMTEAGRAQVNKSKQMFDSAMRMQHSAQWAFKVCLATMIIMFISGLLWREETTRNGIVVYPVVFMLCIYGGICKDISEKKINRVSDMASNMHQYYR